MKLYLILLLIITLGCAEKSSQLVKVKVSFSQNGAIKDFGGTDPTSINDVNCVAVFVRTPEAGNQNTCNVIPGTTVVSPHFIAGTIPVSISGGVLQSGGELSLEVPGGTGRVFQVIGFNSSTSCPDIKNVGDNANLSHPFVLGTTTKDLVPGAVENVNIGISFNSSTSPKLGVCTGPIFGWGLSDLNPCTAVSGCIFWLDAVETTSLFSDSTCTTQASSGDSILCWQDKINSSVEHATATSGYAPTFDSTGLDGLPGVNFDGSTEYLTTNIFSASFPSAWTIFVAYKNTYVGSDLSLFGTVDPPQYMVSQVNEDGYPLLLLGNSGATAFTGSVTLSNEANHIVSYRWDAASTIVDVRVDGSYQGGSSGASTVNSTQPFFVGAQNNAATASDFFVGRIGEMIIYNASITMDNVLQIEDYLRFKWHVF